MSLSGGQLEAIALHSTDRPVPALKRPIVHSTHALADVAAVAAENRLVLHFEHSLWPSNAANVPGRHVSQLWRLALDVTRPLLHALHAELVLTLLYRPALQLRHALWPSNAANVPGRHASQSSSDCGKGKLGVIFPLPQALHTVLPLTLPVYRPAAHSMQDLLRCVVPLKRPMEHGEHSLEPSLVSKRPTEQSTQIASN